VSNRRRPNPTKVQMTISRKREMMINMRIGYGAIQ
jgi:hypothetical protein